MNRNGLIALVAVTVVTAGAALWPARAPESGGSAEAGQIVLPAFAAHPAEAATIELHGGAGAVTLQRQPSGVWVVAEKGGYPADQAKVGRVLLGLARLRLVEAKTRRPDLYPRLAVEDPTGADANSVLVRLRDGSGTDLGDIIVGRSKPDRLGSGSDGTYVRRPGEAQSWLAEGSVEAAPVATEWLDHRLAAIPAARFRQIVTVQPDGTRFVLARARAVDDLLLPDAPADAKYIRPFKRNDLAGLFNGLDLVDVRPAAGFAMPADHVTAEWTGFDGLVVTATLADQDGAHWLRLSAAATDDKARPEAEALNAAWSRWVFAIADAKADAIRIKRGDILEAPKAP